MRLSLLLVALLLSLLTAGTLSAQRIGVGDARGILGKEVTVPITVVMNDTDAVPGVGTQITAVLRLSNPTVFFPQRFETRSGVGISSASPLVRRNDSTYDIRLTLDEGMRPPFDTLCLLRGELLAGSDSICRVTLDSVTIDGRDHGSATGTITSESTGTPLPYVRFATIEQNYPNPVSIGGGTTWAYRIDKPSIVRLECYNVLGEMMWVEQLGDIPAGTHLYSRRTLSDMGPGVYWVRLVTNSGSADKPFHVFQR